MAMQSRIQQTLPGVITREDVFDALRATRDNFKSLLDSRIDTIEAELGVRLSKVLEKRFDDAIQAVVQGQHNGQIKALEASYGRKIKAIEESHSEQLKSLKAELRKTVQNLQEQYSEQLQGLKESYQEALGHLRTLLEAIHIPTPQVSVTLPELRPEVLVRVPELRAPDVVVHVPELQAPGITVNVPELPAPVVNVEAAKNKKTTKHILYDEFSRPSTVVTVSDDPEE